MRINRLLNTDFLNQIPCFFNQVAILTRQSESCTRARIRNIKNLWLTVSKGVGGSTRLLQMTDKWQYDGIMC